MRIVFMGTPEFALPALLEIIGQGHEVVAVYTQPPRKAGRGMELKKSSVHEKAELFGIPVFTPVNFRAAEDVQAFNSHQADVAVVVAYGLLLPPSILQAPKYGCLNLHASLLPRWRGAAPINRALMAGDKETGIMVMQMDEGLDTGPVMMAERVLIPSDMSAGELHDKLRVLGGDLIVRALSGVERASLDAQPQSEEGITYAQKISKDEARIDWSKSAGVVNNHIRGLSPFPGAWCEVELSGKKYRLKILRASIANNQKGQPGEILDDELTVACGAGAIKLEIVQRSGKSVMTAREFLVGNPIASGFVIK